MTRDGHPGITARARITPLIASQSMVAAALAVSRMRPALMWRALDGDLVAGEVSARLRPDNRWFLYFDTWRADAYQPLADAVARDLGRDLYVTLDDAEYDALDACAEAGFAVHRRESHYRIPTDPAVTGLAAAVLPGRARRPFRRRSRYHPAAAAGRRATARCSRLRRLAVGCRRVPRRDVQPILRPRHLPHRDRPGQRRVRRAGANLAQPSPRLGLTATLAQYRRRGVARALLGQTFTVLAARGDTSVVGEVDDTNVASLSLLTGLGARRYGGNVELIRRQRRRSARDWPEERRPSAGS